MIRTAFLAGLCLVLFSVNADARSRPANPAHASSCIPTSDVMRPCAYQPNFLAGVRSIRVTMKRERVVPTMGLQKKRSARVVATTYPQSAYAVARPARYIAGRLICAINVNSALAERGIRGTGSALAKSFLSWGRASQPVPGAVAVSSRRGGGHVAIVSRIEGGKVYVWNPSPRGRGWQEMAYRHQAIGFRVPG
jgi:hypothetical protein